VKVRRNRSPIEDVIRDCVWIRETREGWGGPCSLLKLRQMGSLRVHMKVIFPWLVRYASRIGRRDFCPALTALIGLVQNIFIPRSTLISFYLSSSPSKLDRQSCWTTCLLVCVSGLDNEQSCCILPLPVASTHPNNTWKYEDRKSEACYCSVLKICIFVSCRTVQYGGCRAKQDPARRTRQCMTM
jgi:hypothetical protein